MAFAFLRASWHNLILANYRVPEELLRPRLPPGLELDLFEGYPCASLVAFQFLNTRVLGIPWPGFRNFPEWNLRFYVRQGDRRGVCFVREYVPQRFVAWVARLTYNEPYQAAAMTMDISETPDRLKASYGLNYAGRDHRMWAVGDTKTIHPDSNSTEHFFKEHEWGYGTSHRGRLLTYQVKHREWDVHPVLDFGLDLDWALLYGPEWARMNTVEPSSVVLAKGSRVAVYPHR